MQCWTVIGQLLDSVGQFMNYLSSKSRLLAFVCQDCVKHNIALLRLMQKTKREAISLSKCVETVRVSAQTVFLLFFHDRVRRFIKVADNACKFSHNSYEKSSKTLKRNLKKIRRIELAN